MLHRCSATERLAGARAALEAVGLTLDPALVRDGLHDPAAARAAVAELLARRPAQGIGGH